MPDDERIEQLELQNKVLQANNKGLKDTIDELRNQNAELRDELEVKNAELNKEKDRNIELATTIDALNTDLKEEKGKNKELKKQMGKDLDVVYLQGVYNERDKWRDKIKAKTEELIQEGDYRTADNPGGRVHFHKEPIDYQIAVLQELLEEKGEI